MTLATYTTRWDTTVEVGPRNWTVEIRPGGIGEVVESKNARLSVGTWAGGITAVTDELITEGNELRAFDSRALPDSTWVQFRQAGVEGLS